MEYWEHPQILQRFWAKVHLCEHGRTCKDCCWLWQAGCTDRGYGEFYVAREKETHKEINMRAHVFAYLAAHGRPAHREGAKALICHTCDTPRCCNDWHVFPGTHQENVQDMVQKGRQAQKTGNGRTKLSAGEIARIRALRQQGFTLQAIAATTGASFGYIGSIVRAEKRVDW